MNTLLSSKQWAYCLCAFLLCLLAGALGYLFFNNPKTSDIPYFAEIYQDGSLINTLDLSAAGTPYSLTIAGSAGEINVISVSPEGICMQEASCPDKLCVHQGIIQNDLLPITCLPNKIVIRLVPKKPVAGLPDAVTY